MVNKSKVRGPDEIAVGITTLGAPRLTEVGEGITRLDNMLIGKNFHWQRELEVLLPGRVEIIGNSDDVNKGEIKGDDYSVVNCLPVEKYLECVVGSEMNPEAPVEFLRAHTVISRSWAVGKMLHKHPEDDKGKVDTGDCVIGWDDTAVHKGFDVCSDDHCQRYQGIQPIAPEVLEIIRSTEGKVLVNGKGEIIDARFSKCCGGNTEVFSTCWQDREMDGLKSFRDPWCDFSGLADHKTRRLLRTVLKDYDLSTGGGFRWNLEIRKSDIEVNLREKFKRDIGRILKIIPEERGASGRIKLLRIEGERGLLRLGKELWIRRLLSPTHLYSSAFEIIDRGATVMLEGRGWGHGVGLCQIGAARMALEGAKWDEILHFYYPGTHICDISDIIPVILRDKHG